MKPILSFLLSATLILSSSVTIAQNASTVNLGGTASTQNITNNVATVVDPSFTITSDGNITGFTVMITGSYAAGDILDYTGSVPGGITPIAFNTTSRSLQFTGTTSAANWQTFLRTIRLRTTSATCYQEQRQVSFIVGLKYFNPLNGHFYEVSSGTSSWENGFANAATQSYFGRLGYMATITSQAENSFVSKILAADSWIGASDNHAYINAAVGNTLYANQSAAEGKWYWASGPEKGTQISTANQANISGVYQSWSGGEPNNYGGSEDYAEIYVASGNWNDLPANYNGFRTIIEYGGMSTDNTSAGVVFTRNLMITGAPSGTITGGNVTVCTGTNSTTLTLSNLASGGSVVKWQYSYDDFLTNGVDIPSSASTTYTANNITQNTYYRAVVNAGGCNGLTTSSTRITVNAAVPGNIVADNNTICNGASVNFTLNGYSGSIVKWQVSTSSTFANNVTDIANTTPALSYQLSTAGTYYFRAVVFSCSNTVNTNIYTVNAIAGSAPVGGTVNSVSYCGGSNSGSLSLTGSTGNVSKWQYSTDGGIVWTDVANTTTTQSYSAISATRQYRAILTNGSCGTALSAAGVITVNPASVAGTASGAASVCASTNSTTLSLSGNTGSIQWQSSTNNSSFADIAGEVGASYVAANLSATTYYKAVVTNASCTPATSNTVTVTVKQPSTSTTNASICAGGSYSFGGSSYTTAGTYLVHLTNAVGCDSAATLNLTVNALPPTPTITPSGATTFCVGGSVTLTSDAATSYAWTGGATTQAITVSAGGIYSVTVSDGTCTATSAPVTVVVNSLPVVSGIIQPGQFGNGLNFDGSTDYVSVPSSSSLNISSAITLEAWIYPTKLSGGTQNVMSKSSGGANNGYIFPRTDNSWSSFVVYLNIGGWKTLSFPYPSTGTWHHLAATYDGSTIKLYLDGSMVTSMAASGAISTNSNILSLGNQPGFNEYYGGNADELRIWNVARTQAQIQATMNTELVGNEAGLIAYYNFNQGVAGSNNAAITSVLDKTANANNGGFNTFALNGTISNFVAGATSTGGVAAGNVCVGGIIQLSNTTAGGVWTSSNTAIATVSNTGLVTGVASGTAVISYAVTNANGCATIVITNVTVNDNPVVPAITGNTSVCVGSTTALANTTTGGVWSSASTGIATVNASGVVTGISNGTAVISYAVTNASGCKTTVNTTITVNALPTVNSIGQGGELGNGLALNSAAGNYISVSSNTNMPVTSGAYTIESYIKPNVHGTNGIVGWGNWGNTNQVNALRLGAGNTVINYWWANDLTVVLPNSLVDGLWHHIAATYDGTTRKIYVDGILKGQDNPTGHIVTNTSNMRIGTTNNSEYFNGNMDEVRIWNIARTQAQIQASMVAELVGVESGLVAYYNFNQGVAASNNTGITTLLDKTSNANNGTLQNIALTGTTSNFVSGANGNGASYNVCVGSTMELTNATTGGVWSSLNASVASVNANGIVTGVNAGITTINYTVTNGNGCTTTVSRSVTVNGLPVATISASGSTTLCLGGTITLTASLGNSYAWSNGAITRAITVNTAGAYNVVVTNASGCSTTSANTIVIVNSPSASTTVIKVPFGATYLFNGVTYSATGIYVAHLTNAVGCDSIATLDFTVDPKPSAGADQTIACGSTTKTVTLTGTLPTTGVWSSMAGNDPTATIGTNSNGVVEITLPVAPFTGKLSYVYTTFGGKDTVDIYVTGPTSPVINVNAGSPIICSGSTVQLCPQTWGFSNYQWYKDGYAVAGSTGTSSCITVDATGIGSYTLAGTNGAGCWSVPSAPQVVSTTNTLTKPTISASGSTILCNGGSVTLTSSSATGNLWFKNGNSTGAITPSITVTEPGDYSVLVSTGTCTSAMSLTTTVTGGVKAGFITANATNNCDSTFSFTSTSANTTSTWNFGDGTTATGNSVTHKYTSVALFTVQQAVISAGGCKDTAVQTVTIVSCPPPPPATCNITPGFTIINNTVNGGSYTYISTSTITNGNMTYFWDLGNGTTSTLISPSVTYTTAGTYQVKLVVTGDLGCKDSITQSVVVTITAPPVTPPACTAPVADFTIANATQCLTGNAFSFTNTSTGTAPSYTWTFGDGSAAVTTTAAAYSYTAANTYTVTLVATNSCGSNQVSKTVTVATAPAMPSSISGSTSITAGATTTLSSATTGGVWSSSNTAVATVDANGVVTAIAAGTTTISYTVSNSCGATATTLSITVTAVVPPVTPPVPPVCTAPIADFTINNNTQCLTGNAFNFTNSSTGTTPSYTWTFGDGSAAVTTSNATYNYTTANTYTVTLVATNSCGSNQVSKTVTVTTAPATPSGISGATTITAGTTSNYSSATAGGVWSSSNTAVATVDANTGVVTAVAVGTTTISYTVSNSCGATATSLGITVTAAVPPVVVPPTPAPCNINASFSVNNISQCVNGNQFVFTNTTTGGTAPFTYLWDLNDGTTATTANVTKTYANYGDRDVTLMVTDANGCTSHAAATQIHVGAQPRAGFSILTHTGNGQSTTFISSSTIAVGTMSYLWDLGNGQTSTLINPTTSYTPGNYTIKLVVSGIGTCKDSSIQSITELAVASVKVYPNPVMDVIQVSFVSASSTPTTFKLMDLAGRTLQVQTVTPSSRGVNVLATMNTRGLQSGSYVLYISDEQNGFLATKAILKQ